MARRYDLSVAFCIAGEGIAVQPDSTATRLREIGNATWTLIAQDPGRTRLTSGSAKAVDALNIIDTQYFAADLENEVVHAAIGRGAGGPDHASAGDVSSATRDGERLSR